MKTKSKLLLAALLVIALVQLSCSREDLPLLPNETGYERLQAECEAAGGTWRVEIVDDDLERWCEYPPAANPSPTGKGSTPAGTPSTPTTSQSCDAYGLVSIEVILVQDGPSVTGARNCDYTLTITNNSDQSLIMGLYYVVHNPMYPNDPVMNVPHWGYESLGPRETREMAGHGGDFLPDTVYAGDYITWYMDQIAVTYASCYEDWIYEDPPLAEVTPFIQPLQYYCSP
jgi:hypothetical protein